VAGVHRRDGDRDELLGQRARCTELEWLAFHCNRSHVTAARWPPVGAWQACAARYDVGDDEPLTLGVDVGGARAATALVGCVADDAGVRVALVEVPTGKAAVLDLAASVRELALSGRPIAAVVYDPMRFEGEGQRLERDLGLTLIESPQSPIRMTRCSENLHRLIAEPRLRHFGHRTPRSTRTSRTRSRSRPRAAGGWSRAASRRTSTRQSRSRWRPRSPSAAPSPSASSGSSASPRGWPPMAVPDAWAVSRRAQVMQSPRPWWAGGLVELPVS